MMSFIRDMVAYVRGMLVTGRHLFTKPVTIQYPEQKRTPFPRFRARIVLTRDLDGQERCVACFLCSAVCPVNCISLMPAEGEKGRRYPEWFRINFSRCIFCGMCAEACPTMAIQMTPDYEICERDLMKLVYEKEDLLIDGTGKDPGYNYYRHAAIGVINEKGANEDEYSPEEIKKNLP